MKVLRERGALGLFAATVFVTGLQQAAFGQSQSQSQNWQQFASKGKTATSRSSGWHYFGEATGTKATSVDPKASSALRSDNTGTLEQQMYELINRDRLDPANAAETGVRPHALRWNERLAAVARSHSRDMLNQKFFGHVDGEGRSPAARVKAAGIEWQAVGENIAIYDTIATAQAAFMNEPRFGHNHRSNILDSKYTEVGVGIVQGPDGRYYITQEFLEAPQTLRASF